MPKLTKNAFSRYLRTDCERQLRLLLALDSERAGQDMPGEQPPRPGLAEITGQGVDWQHAKVTDLISTFGQNAVIANPSQAASGRTRYLAIDLAASLTTASSAVGSAVPSLWLVEPEYDIGSAFQQALGIERYATDLGLTYARLRPDLVEALPPGVYGRGISPDGEIEVLASNDGRLQLRVLDIKLTAEPSAAYFGEVTLYSMTLAGWLVDEGLSDQFVVVPDGALWPGSHQASQLVLVDQEHRASGATPTPEQLRRALADDLEEVPFEVFAPRVRGFLQDDLPRVLGEPWQEVQWHVDNRCKGCPFLGVKSWRNANGQETWDPRHCIPEAEESEHLSSVAYVTRGARAALERGGVPDVADLAGREASDAVLDDHHVLRGSRTVVTNRAAVLHNEGDAGVAPTSGTSAIMPRWADLRIHISTDFDPGSAISFSFGVKAFWIEPVPFAQRGQGQQRQTQNWRGQAFIVDTRSLADEERELLAFLRQIDSILTWARQQDAATTVQFYAWDQLEMKHLARVVGRHLQAILASSDVQHLAWLFPSEELVANPRLVTRRSPLTVVRDVVRAVVAAPIAHYYSLLELARIYHDTGLPQQVAVFSIHPLFEDPLSDQIPAERAHEIWSRSNRPPWAQQMRTLQETVEKRLSALETVRRRLEDDLPDLGHTAPRIRIGALQPAGRMAFDSELWLAFAQLNEALAELEVDQVRAMPPHEREAKFASARLERRLHDNEEQQALSALGVSAAAGRRVYRMRPASREVRVRERDFNFALAPESEPGFLDQPLRSAIVNTSLASLHLPGFPLRMENITGVNVVAIDRHNLNLVVDTDDFWAAVVLNHPALLEDLEREVPFDLERDLTLDPVHRDFFTARLRDTLQAIGNPPSAQNAAIAVRLATGATRRRGARGTAHTPAADFLWDAANMHGQRVGRDLEPVRPRLEAADVLLNDSQWGAWEQALTRRLQPIWGPPGTGKSRTVRAIALGAAVHAAEQGGGIRILVCATTYTAIDNVVVEIHGKLDELLPAADVQVHRLRSGQGLPAPRLPDAVDCVVDRRNPSQEIRDLKARLDGPAGITLVAATPMQVRNLLVADDGSPQQELFDLILFDEASQTDVAHAVLPVASLATGGSVVPAGDPKQLPPIHQAEPPLGVEAMVGSVYRFTEDVHGVSPVPLEENYRSNDELVEFARRGGYRRTLQAVSPNLRLDLTAADQQRPDDWPEHLFWIEEWDALLDSEHPAVAFVYDDPAWSSQWNHFEADAVAALVWRLRRRMNRDLLDELDPITRDPLRRGAVEPIRDEAFWERGVGVVTPHRAQQGLVVSTLGRSFPAIADALIRGAVDTVERFQGQQRDVMIATFALGDPDAIRDEDEFLLAFNRFNVVASRARAKLIVLISEQVVEYLSDEVEVLRDSRLLKLYTQSFCGEEREMDLGRMEEGNVVPVGGQYRWHA